MLIDNVNFQPISLNNGYKALVDKDRKLKSYIFVFLLIHYYTKTRVSRQMHMYVLTDHNSVFRF